MVACCLLFFRAFDASRLINMPCCLAILLPPAGEPQPPDVRYPDNWLLRNDQRTLVLTDFGACVDSSCPPSKPPAAAASPSLSASITQSAADPPGLRQADRDPRDVVTGAPSTPEGDDCVAALSGTGSANPRSDGSYRIPSSTPYRASSPPIGVGGGTVKRPREAAMEEPTPAAVAPVNAAASCATSSSSGTRQVQPTTSNGRSGSHAREGAAESQPRKRQRCPGTDWKGGSGRGGGGGEEWQAERKERSENLVFPFSDYFVAGTPSCVAPELAQAWRERTVLDFRRSDVSCLLLLLMHDNVGDLFCRGFGSRSVLVGSPTEISV